MRLQINNARKWENKERFLVFNCEFGDGAFVQNKVENVTAAKMIVT